jgi:predicted Zn-dependent protease with MMP-like domain/Flp pilus assembly protein TadD
MGKSAEEHIDRGYQRLDDGDVEGAVREAKRALEKEPKSPEALTLFGIAEMASGNEAAAEARYREAIAADPGTATPKLYLAELLLGFDRDHAEALELIDKAIAVADDETEKLDAQLLKAEALITLGDRDEEAEAALRALPKDGLPDPEFHLRAGKAHLDLGLLEPAEEHFLAAAELDPDQADAHYGLGLLYEMGDETESMVASWLKVRELDLEEPPADCTVGKEEFVAIAERAVAELPQAITDRIKNVPILAEDYPDAELIKEGFDPRMLGFFTGVPYPEQSNVGGPTGHLECVLLYQRNIERNCTSQEEVADEIKTTVLHETAHFFGLSDEDLEAIGLG